MDGGPSEKLVMLVMLGDTRSHRNVRLLKSLRWGRMCVRDTPDPYLGEKYGFDNGAFPAHLRGMPFPQSDFQRRLEKALKVPADPWLAVAPDIVAGGLHSLEFSLAWIEKLPRHWPWYLAVQDGMLPEDVAPVLHLFSGIFLGGSDKFKGRAFTWCKFAHSNQKKFHYARAGTREKIKHAYMVGSDSMDSSFPLWTHERMSQFIAHIGGLRVQGTLW